MCLVQRGEPVVEPEWDPGSPKKTRWPSAVLPKWDVPELLLTFSGKTFLGKALTPSTLKGFFTTIAQLQYFFKCRLQVKCLSSFSPQDCYTTAHTGIFENVGEPGHARMWKSRAQSSLRQSLNSFTWVKPYKKVVLD